MSERVRRCLSRRAKQENSNKAGRARLSILNFGGVAGEGQTEGSLPLKKLKLKASNSAVPRPLPFSWAGTDQLSSCGHALSLFSFLLSCISSLPTHFLSFSVSLSHTPTKLIVPIDTTPCQFLTIHHHTYSHTSTHSSKKSPQWTVCSISLEHGVPLAPWPP